MALTPAAASASDWSVTQLSQSSAQAAFYATNCPSPSFCAAVGGNGTIAVSVNPTGGASAWRVGRPSGSFQAPDDVAPGDQVYYGGAQIRGVSCPTMGLCVAASLDGRFYTSTDPAGDPSAWKVVKQPESGPNIHMFGVSCPSASFCVVVGYGGKILTSSNPTGDASAWAVAELPKPFDFRGVSCPTTSFCAAVANEGQIVVSDDPDGGAGAWRAVGAPVGEASLNGISCPSTGLCVTASAGQIITSESPGSSGSWNAVTAGSGLPITSISCPSVSACVAVDNNADLLTSTDPTGGQAAWAFENQIPFGQPDGNGMFGISCPSTTFCAAAGQRYQLLTSTNPFAAARPEPGAKGKRVRVVITHHPAKRVDRKKGGTKVSFRFRAVGRAVRFQCKLEGHRYRTCGSPKRYRVGPGKNFFRVRAIGRGGVAGPPTTFHFRVGKLTERGPVGSCENAGPSPLCING
ncbi:MAG TPA: hypothetical protein VFN92_09690 [Solirubrobacterales bacterium]|nr:hypothetical protein [Solirubrobacterales bacterium]